MANVAVEAVDDVRRRLAVEVPETEVRAELDRVYDQLRRDANVPGFRRGRVPRSILERKFGPQVRADVFTRLIQSSLRDALEQENLEPVGRPEVVTEQAEGSGPLRYSATIEVEPEIALGEWQGIEVERPVIEVSDDDVAGYLENLRRSHTQLHPVEERDEARVGDVATVDVTLDAEGTVRRFPGRRIEVGARDAGGVSGHLEGARVGQRVTFEEDLPEDYPESELAGRHGRYTVELHGLAEKHVPELDDDFAKDHGDCDSLDELRDKVRRFLEARAEQQSARTVRSRVVAELVRRHDFAPPPSLVAEREQRLVEELLREAAPGGVPEIPEEMRAEIRERVRPQAVDQVKAGILLDAVARAESIEIAPQEVDQEIVRILQGAPAELRGRLQEIYENPAARQSLSRQIARDRALDRVVQASRVRDGVPEKSDVAEGGTTG